MDGPFVAERGIYEIQYYVTKTGRGHANISADILGHTGAFFDFRTICSLRSYVQEYHTAKYY